MKILYLSSVCSQKRFDLCVAEGKIKKMPQAQKYHRLLIEGLQQVVDQPISVISSYPLERGKVKIYKTEVEEEQSVTYYYPGFIHITFIRQLCLCLNTIALLFSQITKDTIILCDILNGSVCLAARIVRFFSGTKIVGIVTDVPGITSGARRKLLPWWKKAVGSILGNFNRIFLSAYDGYLFLTEDMNTVVNKKKRPYIVLEGHSDIHMQDVENCIDNKSPIKNIMYAGGTHKEFGIALLVEAFLSIDKKDWELHIYGDGNYQKELQLISKEHPNVKYFGMKPNSEIIQQQIKAWILVNPRLTNAEYVKYSFPSKILECMASGTPLLTTCLPGIPKEYYPYIYLFSGETKEEFIKTLQDILSKNGKELHELGAKAKEFAIEEKNNIKQANRLYLFLQKQIYENH